MTAERLVWCLGFRLEEKYSSRLAEFLHCMYCHCMAIRSMLYAIVLWTTVDDVNNCWWCCKTTGCYQLNNWLGKRMAATSVCKQVQSVEYWSCPFDVTYHINGSSLSYQSHFRDLGIIITHDLSPSTHISEIVAKAHQRANLLYWDVLCLMIKVCYYVFSLFM